MFKPHTVLGFGLWLIGVNFLGIPATWKIKLYLATGILLTIIYLLHLIRLTLVRLAQEGSPKADTFAQNNHVAVHDVVRTDTPEL